MSFLDAHPHFNITVHSWPGTKGLRFSSLFIAFVRTMIRAVTDVVGGRLRGTVAQCSASETR